MSSAEIYTPYEDTIETSTRNLINHSAVSEHGVTMVGMLNSCRPGCNGGSDIEVACRLLYKDRCILISVASVNNPELSPDAFSNRRAVAVIGLIMAKGLPDYLEIYRDEDGGTPLLLIDKGVYRLRKTGIQERHDEIVDIYEDIIYEMEPKIRNDGFIRQYT
jgi:hypothetical protein